jgi:hypothetical protein
MTGFWDVIAGQLADLHGAVSADDVLRILANDRNPQGGRSAGDGFFAGTGGDDTVQEALSAAGWEITWGNAIYYVMSAPNGDQITYCEGDIYRGDVSIKS